MMQMKVLFVFDCGIQS